MGKWILVVLIMLVLSLVGIAVLALLLWWLSRQKAEEAAPPVEIEVALPATDAEGLAVATVTEPPALEVEPADVDALDLDDLEVEVEPAYVKAIDIDDREVEVEPVDVEAIGVDDSEVDVEPADVDVREVEGEWEVLELDSAIVDAEVELEESVPEIEVEAEAPTEEAAPPPPDDLTRIAGIGPKISGVFQAAGIRTFADLAATDVSRLEEVLAEESPTLLRLADPTTWPEQAQLAAAGEWEALEALQGTLRGGRRT